MLLDVDALARAEGESWVWQGSQLLRPGYGRALVELSRGGADATVVREFDLSAMAFVDDGFRLPEAKSHRRLDRRRHRLRRHRPRPRLDDRQRLPAHGPAVAAGHPVDDADPGVRGRGHGRLRPRHARPDARLRARPGRAGAGLLPARALPARRRGAAPHRRAARTPTLDLHREWLLVRNRSAVGGRRRDVPGGLLLAADLDAFMAGQRDLDVLFEPDARTSLQDHSWTRHHLILTVLDDVRHPDGGADAAGRRLVAGSRSGVGGRGVLQRRRWSAPTPTPATSTSSAPAASWSRPPCDTAWSVATAEAIKHGAGVLRRAGLRVSQLFATSDDGTRIPYFVVGDADAVGRADAAHRLRRLRGARSRRRTAGSSAGAGWSAAAPTSSPTSAAAASTGPQWHQAALRREPAAGLRGLRRRRRGPGRARGHHPAAAGHPGRQQRRPADGRHAHPLPRAVRRDRLPGAAAGHAPLPPAARRRVLDGGVRRPGRRGRLGLPAQYSPYHNVRPARRTRRRCS